MGEQGDNNNDWRRVLRNERGVRDFVAVVAGVKVTSRRYNMTKSGWAGDVISLATPSKTTSSSRLSLVCHNAEVSFVILVVTSRRSRGKSSVASTRNLLHFRCRPYLRLSFHRNLNAFSWSIWCVPFVFVGIVCEKFKANGKLPTKVRFRSPCSKLGDSHGCRYVAVETNYRIY